MGQSVLRFEGNASTEGNRCLVLLNVHDFLVVTSCLVVENDFNFEVSYLLFP
jgi:hypothetical protein